MVTTVLMVRTPLPSTRVVTGMEGGTAVTQVASEDTTEAGCPRAAPRRILPAHASFRRQHLTLMQRIRPWLWIGAYRDTRDDERLKSNGIHRDALPLPALWTSLGEFF